MILILNKNNNSHILFRRWNTAAHVIINVHKMETAHRCPVAKLVKFCNTRSGRSSVGTAQGFRQ